MPNKSSLARLPKTSRRTQLASSRSLHVRRGRSTTPPKCSLLPEELTLPFSFGLNGRKPWALVQGDALAALRQLASSSVDCVVTSPPYYWQRDYGVPGQSGQEPTIEGYVRNIVRVFHELKRVVSKRATVFLVLGDTYYSGKGKPKGNDPKQMWRSVARDTYRAVDRPGLGLPRKSLIGIPWRVALALQRDGWVLRSAVTWQKPKTLAEPSVKDRPWNSCETVFILAKNPKYYFNRPALGSDEDVWVMRTSGGRTYRHAAPFPLKLADRCLAIGCPKGGTVLDPYAGSGTTLLAAVNRGLPAIGIELNPDYCRMTKRRLIFR